MAILRQWLLSLTLAALAGALVSLLAPKGATQKALRTVVAVFLLSVLLLPVAQLRGVPLTLPQPQESAVPAQEQALEELLQSQALQAQQTAVSSVLQRALTQEGAIFGQITFVTDNPNGTRIQITQVQIPLHGACVVSAQELERLVLAETGLNIKIRMVTMGE